MPDDLLSIGALARASGLAVSALRYYDAAGVLRPAHVDPATGYRWYGSAQVHGARLVASLRQAGLPVPDLVAVLAAPDQADAVLARHRRRLEEDLEVATTHLDAAEALLRQPGRCTVVARDLVAAVAAVRHAVGRDPRWPGLGGVLLHLDGATLRLVACDRFRIAVATVPVRQPSGAQARVVAPLALLEEVVSARLPDVGSLTLAPRRLDVLGHVGEPLPAAYPDYEALLPPGRSQPATTVAWDELAETVARADDVVVVRLDGGRAEVAAPRPTDTLGYSRSFLLDAVRAARSEHVALARDDERSALSVSPADRPHDVGLVMPVLLRR